jgi:hypothetical protein
MYQVRVKGSNFSVERLGINTVVLNLHGAPGVHVTDADGNLQRKAEGTFIIAVRDARVIGPNGEERSLSAGKAYRVGKDGRTPEEVKTPGTAFTVDYGGNKQSYVVGDDGKPTELYLGDCVRISGGKGTDANGGPLEAGFYRVGADGKFKRKNAGDCIVALGGARVFDADGEKTLLFAGAYIMGDGGQPKKIETPGTAFTVVDGEGGKQSYVVDKHGQLIWLRHGDFVQISGDKGKGTDANGDLLTEGFYEVNADGKFERKNAGDRVVISRSAKGFNANGNRLLEGNYKVSADGKTLEKE